MWASPSGWGYRERREAGGCCRRTGDMSEAGGYTTGPSRDQRTRTCTGIRRQKSHTHIHTYAHARARTSSDFSQAANHSIRNIPQSQRPCCVSREIRVTSRKFTFIHSPSPDLTDYDLLPPSYLFPTSFPALSPYHIQFLLCLSSSLSKNLLHYPVIILMSLLNLTLRARNQHT